MRLFCWNIDRREENSFTICLKLKIFVPKCNLTFVTVIFIEALNIGLLLYVFLIALIDTHFRLIYQSYMYFFFLSATIRVIHTFICRDSSLYLDEVSI